MYDVKLKSKKIQMQVSGMGLQLFAKGRKLETYMYQSLTSWGDLPGKGIEVVPRGGKAVMVRTVVHC
eukprot:SAG22_NODE_217_length_14910_cov_65.532978_7_plen_67_part_00